MWSTGIMMFIRGILTYLGRNLCCCHFVSQKVRADGPVTEPRSPAATHLHYGMVMVTHTVLKEYYFLDFDDHLVWYKFSDVLEECLTRLHGITSQ
jgi:hypothetical protein